MPSPSPLGDPWCGIWTIMVQPGVNWVANCIFKFVEYLFGKLWNFLNKEKKAVDRTQRVLPPPINFDSSNTTSERKKHEINHLQYYSSHPAAPKTRHAFTFPPW
ncbi:hypothetical protein EV426DRAFT_645400 [Tirmania nivea]|nr:hypothetical protein EV426DRAFT_645400 [Tirmania nivea]